MPGPDLRGATATVESLMDDTCAITRNPGGATDATLDPDTGAYVDPTPFVQVYDGSCKVAPIRQSWNRTASEGGVTYSSGTYVLTLPVTVLRDHPEWEPEVNDEVVMTWSMRDSSLVGRRFRISGVERKTFVVSRRCMMELVS